MSKKIPVSWTYRRLKLYTDRYTYKSLGRPTPKTGPRTDALPLPTTTQRILFALLSITVITHWSSFPKPLAYTL